MRNNILDVIRLKYCARMDADEENSGKKKSSKGAVTLPYGLCKSVGIDTKGMTPRQAWKAYSDRTGFEAGEAYRAHFKGGPAPVPIVTPSFKISKKWFADKLAKEKGSKPKHVARVRETPKAVLGVVYYEDGSEKMMWVPKSVLEAQYEWTG